MIKREQFHERFHLIMDSNINWKLSHRTYNSFSSQVYQILWEELFRSLEKELRLSIGELRNNND